VRSTELRVAGMTFADEASEQLWKAMLDKKVNLVPIRSLGAKSERRAPRKSGRYYKLSGPIAFLHVSLLDNRSEFFLRWF